MKNSMFFWCMYMIGKWNPLLSLSPFQWLLVWAGSSSWSTCTLMSPFVGHNVPVISFCRLFWNSFCEFSKSSVNSAMDRLRGPRKRFHRSYRSTLNVKFQSRRPPTLIQAWNRSWDIAISGRRATSQKRYSRVSIGSGLRGKSEWRLYERTDLA